MLQSSPTVAMQSITHIAASAIRVTSPHARRIAAYPHALAGTTSLSSRAPRTSLCRHRSVVQQITRIVCTSRVVCAGSPNVKEEVHRQSDHTSLYIRLSRFNFRLDLISMRYSGESRLHWRRWHQFRITRGTLGPLSSFTASAGCLFLSYSGPEPEAGPATHRYVTEWWVCCTFNIPSALRPAAHGDKWKNTKVFPNYQAMLDDVDSKPTAAFIGLPPKYHGALDDPNANIEVST